MASVLGTDDGGGFGVKGTSATAEGVHGETASPTMAAVAGIATAPNGIGAGVFGRSLGQGPGIVGVSAHNEGVHGETSSTAMAAIAGFAINPQGTGAGIFGESRGHGPGVVGVSATNEGVHGQTASATMAAVAGTATNPEGTGAGIYGESRGKGPAGFFKGDVEVTGDIRLTGADLAEDFDIADPAGAEPGTVMVVDDAGTLAPCSSCYDKRVVGVVSGAGDHKVAIRLDHRPSDRTRCPIALIGKVFCKVDAAQGGVEAGDLLTTSDTPGFAMKANPTALTTGAIVGKALRPLAEGRGLIPILVGAR